MTDFLTTNLIHLFFCVALEFFGFVLGFLTKSKFSTDHPIDPPKDTSDPWDIDFPPDMGYTIRAVNGVFNVFKDEVS